MKPTEHDNLLFDDGAFSRSRRYFWAIDCLSEFDVVVSDNIVQWELYRAARIQPLLEGHGLPDLDMLQLKQVERRYEILCNQREFFRQKLTATKALRDAVSTSSHNWVPLAYPRYQLFNASAVIESRASTRLGENVKLLTYVSIFFLPLAFCTVSKICSKSIASVAGYKFSFSFPPDSYARLLFEINKFSVP